LETPAPPQWSPNLEVYRTASASVHYMASRGKSRMPTVAHGVGAVELSAITLGTRLSLLERLTACPTPAQPHTISQTAYTTTNIRAILRHESLLRLTTYALK